MWDYSMSYLKDCSKRIIKKRRNKVNAITQAGKSSSTTPLISASSNANISLPLPVHSTAGANPAPLSITSTASSGAKPLGAQGWNARYEYKLGVYAQQRSDFQNAAKHYEDSYNLVVEMLKSEVPVKNTPTTPLQSISNLFPTPSSAGSFYLPYSKRWEEALDLADFLCREVIYTLFSIQKLINLRFAR